MHVLLLLPLALSAHTVWAGNCDGKGDGMYVDPTNPNKYFQCVGSIEYNFNCGAGLVFYENIHACGWPDSNSPSIAPVIVAQTNAPAVTFAPVGTGDPVPTGSQCKRRVCYLTNWSQYRQGPAKFFPDDTDPSICTHLIYSFAKLVGNQLAPFEWNDESTDWSTGLYERCTNLKQRNPNLKVLIAVGGWNLGSSPFHQVVDTAVSRAEFVTTTIAFLRAHNFDGLDLDWEYPANRGSPDSDRHKFTLLVQELRTAFNNEASGNNRLLLTAAVGAGKATVDTGYEIPDVSKNLDFINLMSYDLHGGWEPYTGHNSPLYASSQDTGDNAYLNVDWAAQYWVQKGCPSDKLVVGMPLYGRSFTLTSSDTGLYAPASTGDRGPYTAEAGYLAYYEICEILNKGAQSQLLSDQHVPYIVDGNQWIGYDSESSLREKVRYVRSNNLGGAMVWAVDLDDFKGQFCGKGSYPLLGAIKDECNK